MRRTSTCGLERPRQYTAVATTQRLDLAESMLKRSQTTGSMSAGTPVGSKEGSRKKPFGSQVGNGESWTL